MSCKDCRHYFETMMSTPEGVESGGLCRRYPPQVTVVSPGAPDTTDGFRHISLWPVVYATWECGEFTVREEIKQ